jgi:hypothetical protein
LWGTLQLLLVFGPPPPMTASSQVRCSSLNRSDNQEPPTGITVGSSAVPTADHTPITMLAAAAGTLGATRCTASIPLVLGVPTGPGHHRAPAHGTDPNAQTSPPTGQEKRSIPIRNRQPKLYDPKLYNQERHDKGSWTRPGVPNVSPAANWTVVPGHCCAKASRAPGHATDSGSKAQ